jgi:CPA2 family monovalent cation:H+ antiporter-2
MATTLLVTIGTSVATSSVGLSMALGAFVAGLLLAETEYRRAVEATIEPFKGLLLGVFFFSVGMSVDPVLLASRPFAILGFALSLLMIKGLVMVVVARGFRLPWATAIETAFLTGPGGEFAFIVLGIATTLGVIAPDVSAVILAVVSLTMIVLPFYAQAGRKLAKRFEKLRALDPETLVAPPSDRHKRTIIVGAGRVGDMVAELHATHKQPFLMVDRDPTTVTLARRKGRPAYFGNATDAAFLTKLDIEEALMVVVTVQDTAIADEVVRTVRTLRPDIPITARARDAAHASHLYELGVTDAVPETIEASFQLSEAALVGIGVAMGPVIASIHDKRDEVRKVLKKAKAANA